MGPAVAATAVAATAVGGRRRRRSRPWRVCLPHLTSVCPSSWRSSGRSGGAERSRRSARAGARPRRRLTARTGCGMAAWPATPIGGGRCQAGAVVVGWMPVAVCGVGARRCPAVPPSACGSVGSGGCGRRPGSRRPGRVSPTGAGWLGWWVLCVGGGFGCGGWPGGGGEAEFAQFGCCPAVGAAGGGVAFGVLGDRVGERGFGRGGFRPRRCASRSWAWARSAMDCTRGSSICRAAATASGCGIRVVTRPTVPDVVRPDVTIVLIFSTLLDTVRRIHGADPER